MKKNLVVWVLLPLLGACGAPAGVGVSKPAAVDRARLLAADAEPGNWMSHGRTYDEQRFSPLTQITSANVKQLGLAWSVDLDTAHRGQESTPLVIDGVMYVTGAWSKVWAFDAKTGAQKWAFDPKVPGAAGANACCDVVNRGVAAWQGKIYVGTLDGRLIALDAQTGQSVWSVATTRAGSRYTITGAPRVVDGKVLIGNGGAEMGVRGYIAAFDATDGHALWKFYTVPGNPADGFENQAMEKAAATWKGAWWKLGGGGTVWDSMAYDAKLNLLYIGVGNGSPWMKKLRSPGEGDNLYLCSIVAINATTGEYVWHYQTTPGESWDFDATQHMILADLQIGGKLRSVLMQAPKNGIYYVLDRATGELLSAKPFATVNWTTGVDRKSGRPLPVAAADYGATGQPFLSMPGPGGAHNWQPMSFSPKTQLVYLPVTEVGFPYFPDHHFKAHDLGWNIGADFNAGSLPQDPKIKAQIKSGLKGHLLAWDPVQSKEVWRAELHSPWNGGVVSTAGNLVFEGNAHGEFVAYRADNGERLWSFATQAGVLAAPISYAVDGEQYVAIEVGYGGAFGLAAGELSRDTHIASNVPRMLVFKLGAHGALPPAPPATVLALDPPADTASAAALVTGKALFHVYCSACHGDSATSGGVLPDLRRSLLLKDRAAWEAVVLNGALTAKGMVSFKAEFDASGSEQIRAYVIHRATEDRRSQQP